MVKQESEKPRTRPEKVERYHRNAERAQQRACESRRNEQAEQDSSCRLKNAVRIWERSRAEKLQTQITDVQHAPAASTGLQGSASGHRSLPQEQLRVSEHQQTGSQKPPEAYLKGNVPIKLLLLRLWKKHKVFAMQYSDTGRMQKEHCKETLSVTELEAAISQVWTEPQIARKAPMLCLKLQCLSRAEQFYFSVSERAANAEKTRERRWQKQKQHEVARTGSRPYRSDGSTGKNRQKEKRKHAENANVCKHVIGWQSIISIVSSTWTLV